MAGNSSGKSSAKYPASAPTAAPGASGRSGNGKAAPAADAGALAWPSLLPLGNHQGKPPIPMMRPVILVGSRTNAHLHLLSRQVSKAHALILIGDGKTYIRDLASRTHVYVNGQEMREADLQTGDLLQIGGFKFQYQAAAGMKQRNRDQGPPAMIDYGGELPVRLDQRVLLIGRRPVCDLNLPDDSVSTAHAVIFSLGGKRYIRDLGSRTGCIVNGKNEKQVELRFGDRIQIGDNTLQYTPATGRMIRDSLAGEDQMDELENLVGTAPLGHESPDLDALLPPPVVARAASPKSPAGKPPVQSPAAQSPAARTPAYDAPIPMAPFVGVDLSQADEDLIPLAPADTQALPVEELAPPAPPALSPQIVDDAADHPASHADAPAADDDLLESPADNAFFPAEAEAATYPAAHAPAGEDDLQLPEGEPLDLVPLDLAPHEPAEPERHTAQQDANDLRGRQTFVADNLLSERLQSTGADDAMTSSARDALELAGPEALRDAARRRQVRAEDIEWGDEPAAEAPAPAPTAEAAPAGTDDLDFVPPADEAPAAEAPAQAVEEIAEPKKRRWFSFGRRKDKAEKAAPAAPPPAPIVPAAEIPADAFTDLPAEELGELPLGEETFAPVVEEAPAPTEAWPADESALDLEPEAGHDELPPHAGAHAGVPAEPWETPAEAASELDWELQPPAAAKAPTAGLPSEALLPAEELVAEEIATESPLDELPATEEAATGEAEAEWPAAAEDTTPQETAAEAVAREEPLELWAEPEADTFAPAAPPAHEERADAYAHAEPRESAADHARDVELAQDLHLVGPAPAPEAEAAAPTDDQEQAPVAEPAPVEPTDVEVVEPEAEADLFEGESFTTETTAAESFSAEYPADEAVADDAALDEVLPAEPTRVEATRVAPTPAHGSKDDLLESAIEPGAAPLIVTPAMEFSAPLASDWSTFTPLPTLLPADEAMDFVSAAPPLDLTAGPSWESADHVDAQIADALTGTPPTLREAIESPAPEADTAWPESSWPAAGAEPSDEAEVLPESEPLDEVEPLPAFVAPAGAARPSSPTALPEPTLAQWRPIPGERVEVIEPTTGVILEETPADEATPEQVFAEEIAAEELAAEAAEEEEQAPADHAAFERGAAEEAEAVEDLGAVAEAPAADAGPQLPELHFAYDQTGEQVVEATEPTHESALPLDQELAAEWPTATAADDLLAGEAVPSGDGHEPLYLHPAHEPALEEPSAAPGEFAAGTLAQDLSDTGFGRMVEDFAGPSTGPLLEESAPAPADVADAGAGEMGAGERADLDSFAPAGGAWATGLDEAEPAEQPPADLRQEVDDLERELFGEGVGEAAERAGEPREPAAEPAPWAPADALDEVIIPAAEPLSYAAEDEEGQEGIEVGLPAAETFPITTAHAPHAAEEPWASTTEEDAGAELLPELESGPFSAEGETSLGDETSLEGETFGAFGPAAESAQHAELSQHAELTQPAEPTDQMESPPLGHAATEGEADLFASDSAGPDQAAAPTLDDWELAEPLAGETGDFAASESGQDAANPALAPEWSETSAHAGHEGLAEDLGEETVGGEELAVDELDRVESWMEPSAAEPVPALETEPFAEESPAGEIPASLDESFDAGVDPTNSGLMNEARAGLHDPELLAPADVAPPFMPPPPPAPRPAPVPPPPPPASPAGLGSYFDMGASGFLGGLPLQLNELPPPPPTFGRVAVTFGEQKPAAGAAPAAPAPAAEAPMAPVAGPPSGPPTRARNAPAAPPAPADEPPSIDPEDSDEPILAKSRMFLPKRPTPPRPNLRSSPARRGAEPVAEAPASLTGGGLAGGATDGGAARPAMDAFGGFSHDLSNDPFFGLNAAKAPAAKTPAAKTPAAKKPARAKATPAGTPAARQAEPELDPETAALADQLANDLGAPADPAGVPHDEAGFGEPAAALAEEPALVEDHHGPEIGDDPAAHDSAAVHDPAAVRAHDHRHDGNGDVVGTVQHFDFDEEDAHVDDQVVDDTTFGEPVSGAEPQYRMREEPQANEQLDEVFEGLDSGAVPVGSATVAAAATTAKARPAAAAARRGPPPAAEAGPRRGPTPPAAAARRPAARPAVAPARAKGRGSRIGLLLVVMLLLMAVAAAGIYWYYKRHSTLSGAVSFGNIASLNRDELDHFHERQVEMVKTPDLRREARTALSLAHQGTPFGFLDEGSDPVERARNLAFAWPATRDEPGATLVLTYRAADPADAWRLDALRKAVFKINENRLRDAREARNAMEEAQARQEKLKQDLAPLKQQLERARHSVETAPTAADVTALKAECDKLESAWGQAMETSRLAEAEVRRAEAQAGDALPADSLANDPANNAPPPAAATNPAADSQLSDLQKQMGELSNTLSSARKAADDEAEKARAALDQTMDDFNRNLGSIQASIKDSPELAAYVNAAENLQLTTRKLAGDLLERQQKTHEHLLEMKKRLDERIEARRQEVWAADSMIRDLQADYAFRHRGLSAARESGYFGEIDKIKKEMAATQDRIEARKMELGKDVILDEFAKQLEQDIIASERQMESDRAFNDQLMKDMEKTFAVSSKVVEKLPQEQQAAAARLAEKVKAMNAARQSYAQRLESKNADSNENLKALDTQVQSLAAKLEDRKKQLAADSARQLTEQEKEQRKLALEKKREDAERAKATETKAYAAYRAKNKDLRAMQEDLEDSHGQGELTQRLIKQVQATEQDLAQITDTLKLRQAEAQKVVYPEPITGEITEIAVEDPRGHYALAAVGGIAVVFSVLILLTLRGEGRHGRQDYYPQSAYADYPAGQFAQGQATTMQAMSAPDHHETEPAEDHEEVTV